MGNSLSGQEEEDATEPVSVPVERGDGLMLGLMVGDALGAPVEGWPPEEIMRFSQERTGEAFLSTYIPAIQMGTVVPKAYPQIGYRWATELEDQAFVGTGPPSGPALEPFARSGCYTDDSNTALALAESIVAEGRLAGKAAALNYVKAWRSTPTRGYPPSAKAVMKAVEAGVDYTRTGLPPHFPFPGGSFANGGAMRISPLVLAFRRASLSKLRKACTEAVRSSHCHPEAVDGAFVQAAVARQALLSASPADFIESFDRGLQGLTSACASDAMRQRLVAIQEELAAVGGTLISDPTLGDFERDLACLKRIVPNTRPGSGLTFQIAAIDALACVLFFAKRYALFPWQGLQRTVGAGGDTDTIASMVGAIFGAMHGTDWLPPHLVAELENGERGRDFALGLARALLELDLI